MKILKVIEPPYRCVGCGAEYDDPDAGEMGGDGSFVCLACIDEMVKRKEDEA